MEVIYKGEIQKLKDQRAIAYPCSTDKSCIMVQFNSTLILKDEKLGNSVENNYGYGVEKMKKADFRREVIYLKKISDCF